MATFPKDIPDFRAALLAFVMPAPAEDAPDDQVVALEAAETAVYAAQATASPVVQIVQVYDALKPHAASLDDAGRKLLAGAAYLVHQGQFFGKGAEAFDTFNAILPTLAD